jgi:dUTP pyrophosphatase
MKILVKRINQAARLPVYNHPGDAGLDLFSCQAMTIGPGETAAVPTGLQLLFPSVMPAWSGTRAAWLFRGFTAWLGDRCRLPGRSQNSSNQSQPEAICYYPGMKIAQLLVQPVEIPEPVEVETLDETRRGEAGFGSTGLF